ncbi:MAG: hypothetical protein H0T46_15450 [Deltaproteobacteria bacterium]|nr:hypothetical protein [Deltaproteobacteria bacterium]
MERPTSWLELGVFTVALLVLVATAGSGPGWDLASGHAVLAAQLERTSAAPLYGLLADLAAQLPAGEVGFRLGVLGAVLGALTLAGVVAAARAVLPKDPIAGLVGAVLLALAPPFRDAAAFATPSLLAACGAVWAFAGAAAHAREPAVRQLTIALVGAAAVIGSAPWLGAVLTVATIAWLDRSNAKREHLAIGTGAIGIAMITWWLGSLGALPGVDPSLTAMVAASGQGAAAIVIGTGLLGAAFGAATSLAPARALLAWIVLAVAHAIVIDHAAEPLLGLLAIGCAIVPSAVARVMPEKRALVVPLAGVPLVGAALAAGAAFSIDDPHDAPARLATDMIGGMPPGPGVIVMTSATAWSAVSYAQVVAGARPDLVLLPPLPVTTSDGAVADALRADQIAVSDVPAFGRLDPTRALARGRGFQLRTDQPEPTEVPAPPATYASSIGDRLAVALAIARGRYEAAHGRLDAAARATGLTSRFGAAELAMLATTAPSRERPALFGFLPRLDDPPGSRWRLDLFGDDLAWVAGIEQPLVASPPSRKLHGLWRELLAGKRTPDDSEIFALGPAAVAATRELVAAVRTPPGAPSN